MEIRPLTNEDLDLVYAAFLEAFSDYLVKMNPSREQFAEMLIRRGYVPQASAGAFQGQRLVGFTLNGVEGTLGYDTGTGVVPYWDTRQRWWTVNPSWQNSSASIRRARDRFVILGNDDCYAILFRSNGDLAQMAVRPERRRQRFGTRLLQAVEALAGKPLRLMNVDDGDEGIARFLEHAGAIRTVRQIEMAREL